MRITWYGHSAFKVEAGGARIFVDPYLEGNPAWTGDWEGPADGITHVLITHGHGDHISSAAHILKKTGAMLVANYEICSYFAGQGAVASDRINPGNTGGTVDCGGFTTTFVQAIHSSSLDADKGGNIYLGNPNGLVLHFPDDKTLYAMGDTDIFGDMALINELHDPKVAFVPVGDRFTMGGAVAALACRRFFQLETAIPCHFGTFPLLDQTADKFVDGMEDSGTKVVVAKIGKPFEV